MSSRNIPLKPIQGRVVYLKEQAPYIERAALLILYAFSIRLQSEDYGFISGFIERHLSIRCALKLPYHWQQTSAPQLDSSHQNCYKRVALACHITYLTLSSKDTKIKENELLDRRKLFPFQRSTNESPGQAIFQASSSVLLTIALPEEAISREEEVQLLQAPQGQWTVLVVNSSPWFSSNQSASQHLTPIAQYLRGVAFSLHTQRLNAESIYDTMRERLKDCYDGSLFDDEQYTKSALYHWTIRTCDELRESVSSSLRFLRRALDNQMNELCRNAHSYEKLGVDYWKQQLEDEIYNLEELQSQILALNLQAQESRNALHGVTAVLEARVAVQQGDRLKLLAYVATLYLPVAAASSIYGMNVLPSSATLWSFFVMLFLFFFGTVCIGLYLSTLLAWLQILPALAARANHQLTKLQYIRLYIDLLNPSSEVNVQLLNDPDWVEGSNWLVKLGVWLLWWPLRALPAILVHYVFVRELFFLRDQYVALQYYGNVVMGQRIYWHPLGLVRDIVRFILLPVWAAAIVGIVCLLVLEDILFLIFNVISRGLRFICCWRT
ncbi:hypothetical protein CC78DRAFT_537401 [Lojkania enalia]|uniref:Uncharacterized protein n=1 Tax=Lojkania enalia TaxID=147567 RepID=A0A9P4MY93_9PLEO|nr:hypothetical protein CC78DRAFT_537401 [Didymosphaeria enalia]